MKRIIAPIQRLLARSQTRFRTSRPGSVLILVVALLVLMAFIATAWMSTVRIDRYGSEQHTANTQIDLLVEGVKQMVQGVITDDLKAGTAFRPPMSRVKGAANGYENWDATTVPPPAGAAVNPPPFNSATVLPPAPAAGALGAPEGPVPNQVQQDNFLSSRIPSLVNNNAAPGPANLPIWDAIGAPLIGSYFESPYRATVGATYTQRARMQPWVLNLSAGGAVTPMPAWSFAGNVVMLAADADGDGVADSGLFRLPIGQINGVTYYAAARIVDNGSGINLNTAFSRNYDFDRTGAAIDSTAPAAPQLPKVGAFRSDVGLVELLKSYRIANPTMPPAIGSTLGVGGAGTFGLEARNLAEYRMNGGTFTDLGIGGAGATSDPPTETGTTGGRADFHYLTLGDSWEHQLARRLANPGRLGSGTATVFHPHSLSDAVALAHRFCLVSQDNSPSDVEQSLGDSLFYIVQPSSGNPGGTRYQNRPYRPVLATAANDLFTWYRDNFNYGLSGAAGNPYVSLRAIAVTTGPVSNIIPAKSAAAVATGAPDIPAVPKTANEMAVYSTTPSKTNINTADFKELYRAFWNVMTDSGNDAVWPLAYAAGVNGHMFRSPVDPSSHRVAAGVAGGPAVMTPIDVVLMRAAMAAVNAMDMRDSDDDVTTRQITLPNGNRVRVFGCEKQPFITEVYVNNNNSIDTKTDPRTTASGNPNGYVAIELHNPYPAPLVLNNCTLALVNRSAGAMYPLTITPITPAAGGLPGNTMYLNGAQAQTGNGTVTIPPNSYLILDNFGGPTATGGNATYIPLRASSGGAVTRVYIPNLHEALINGGREVVLLRTRAATGAPVATPVGTPADRQYDEGTLAAANLNEWVPLDSFDFAGAPAPPTLPPYTSWTYKRPNGPGADNFKCAYAGDYNVAAAATSPRQEAFTKPWATWAADITFPQLGVADPSTTPFILKNPYPPIQVGNIVGPNPATPANNYFPFGGFARNGDLLQIPFMGSYQIRANATVPAASFLEMSPLPLDCGMVRSGPLAPAALGPAPAYNAKAAEHDEHLGRFYPMKTPAADLGGPGVANVNDNDPLGTYDDTSAGVQWRYRWATRILDYLTVQAPSNDYSPDTDPAKYPVAAGAVAVANAQTGVTGSPGEDAVPLEGLININTAPWYVLATLPMLPAGNGVGQAGADGNGNGVPDNIEYLAKAIVLYRDGDGSNVTPPHVFTNIFDLQRVGPEAGNAQQQAKYAAIATAIGPGVKLPPAAINNPANDPQEFRNAMGDPTNATTPDYTNGQGDITPLGAADGVRGDAEERFMMLTRISNLITTRSDSFTCYVLVQGWRNVGTVTPELVVQRRAAFIIDRSRVARDGTGTVRVDLSPANVDTN